VRGGVRWLRLLIDPLHHHLQPTLTPAPTSIPHTYPLPLCVLQHPVDGFARVTEKAHKSTVWMGRHLPQVRGPSSTPPAAFPRGSRGGCLRLNCRVPKSEPDAPRRAAVEPRVVCNDWRQRWHQCVQVRRGRGVGAVRPWRDLT
jgi:hypothetical protein